MDAKKIKEFLEIIIPAILAIIELLASWKTEQSK